MHSYIWQLSLFLKPLFEKICCWALVWKGFSLVLLPVLFSLSCPTNTLRQLSAPGVMPYFPQSWKKPIHLEPQIEIYSFLSSCWSYHSIKKWFIIHPVACCLFEFYRAHSKESALHLRQHFRIGNLRTEVCIKILRTLEGGLYALFTKRKKWATECQILLAKCYGLNIKWTEDLYVNIFIYSWWKVIGVQWCYLINELIHWKMNCWVGY